MENKMFFQDLIKIMKLWIDNACCRFSIDSQIKEIIFSKNNFVVEKKLLLLKMFRFSQFFKVKIIVQFSYYFQLQILFPKNNVKNM